MSQQEKGRPRVGECIARLLIVSSEDSWRMYDSIKTSSKLSKLDPSARPPKAPVQTSFPGTLCEIRP